MPEETTQQTTAPTSETGEDAFIAAYMKGEAPAPKLAQALPETKAAPAEEKAPAPAPAPEPETEEPAETEAVEETAPAAEEPQDEPEAAEDPGVTPRIARLSERFLTQGFRYSPNRLDRMDDSAIAKEADSKARETLLLAKFPKRLVDQMEPGERLEAALDWRPRVLEGQRNFSRSKADGLPGTKTIGEGRTAARTQPGAGAPQDPSPGGTDPLEGLGDELELFDPAVKAKVEKLQAERDQLSRKYESASRIVAATNLAEAIGTVDDARPGVADDHQAVMAAAKDLALLHNHDWETIVASGGDALVRLVERAAEELGFTQRPRRNATERPTSKAPPRTPPKPSGRGGKPAPMTEDQKDLRAVEALMQARGDPAKAASIYHRS